MTVLAIVLVAIHVLFLLGYGGRGPVVRRAFVRGGQRNS